MKRIAKAIIVGILTRQVRLLRKRNRFTVVAVAGSIGKTSTKFAIANMLAQRYRVQFQEGNYNDIVSVPLIYFGQSLPVRLVSPMEWLRIFRANAQLLKQPYPFDVVVIELGTDGPGQLRRFRRYGHPDITVLTAITAEHMEFFADLDAVAREELAVFDFSETVLVNADLCDAKYLPKDSRRYIAYAIKAVADYQLSAIRFDGSAGFNFTAYRNAQPLLEAAHAGIAESQLYSIEAAIAVADQLNLSTEEILAGISSSGAVSGRMQRLRGIHDSVIIDDTYNASPDATIAALDALYKLDAPQKIAILGNMNELGDYSRSAHEAVGRHCDPRQLDLVITIGPDANQYLATTAENNRCRVERFDDPYKAGAFLAENIKEHAAILAKGSQNGVFAEEAIKQVLADAADQKLLVRQSEDWLQKKQRSFTPTASS
jgi:UDP-N-acetylmuramoyl-tripeptide--D-alanyl-D-alanine ligase